jgi:DNA-binding transcriptional MerR regulator
MKQPHAPAADRTPADIKLEKLFYKIGEVSLITGLEAYVLRYWETEFPVLRPKKSRGGQRVYLKKDVETILLIKRMLYQEGFTIAGARKKLMRRQAASGVEEIGPLAHQPTPSEALVTRMRAELAEILRIVSSYDRKQEDS